MNQKRILVGAGIVLLLGLSGGFWLWQGTKDTLQSESTRPTIQQQPAPTDEVASVQELIDGEYTFTPLDTADWQVYQDKEFGYLLKLPKSIKRTDQQSFVDSSGRDISFYIIPYDRLKKKQLDDIPENDFLDSALVAFIKSGNIDVSFRKKQINNNTKLILVEYLFKKEPRSYATEAWTEGGNLEEVFFQCGSDICAIRTISDQFTQEKRTLFYTILSTLRLVE